VVIAPGVVGERIRDVHLVHLGPDQVLSIVVTERGRVLQERLRPAVAVDADELEEAERIISQVAVGACMGAPMVVGDHLRHGVAERVWETVGEVVAMIERIARTDGDVYVGGTGQLAAVWEDLSEVQRVLEVVERETLILNILAGAPGTSIRIGSELPVADVDMAVVSKTYDTGAASGALGVIGPMRMNYRRAISAVEEVSRRLQDRIQA
jgi:heat-inducible transcriptional repressor